MGLILEINEVKRTMKNETLRHIACSLICESLSKLLTSPLQYDLRYSRLCIINDSKMTTIIRPQKKEAWEVKKQQSKCFPI
jgi:hypothetical protein